MQIIDISQSVVSHISINDMLIKNNDYSFLYFLLNDVNELVYIGQTMNRPKHRIQCHKKDKEFSSYFFISVCRESVSRLEKFFIKKYSPLYNKMYNINVDMKNISLEKFEAIQKILEDKSI